MSPRRVGPRRGARARSSRWRFLLRPQHERRRGLTESVCAEGAGDLVRNAAARRRPAPSSSTCRRRRPPKSMSAIRGSPAPSSARRERIYVSAIANGQTRIFVLGGDRGQIAALEVSVGRDVGATSVLALGRRACRARPSTLRRSRTRSSSSARSPRRATLKRPSTSHLASSNDSAGASGSPPAPTRQLGAPAEHQGTGQGGQLAHHPRPRPGDPAGDGPPNPPRDRQAARRHHERRRGPERHRLTLQSVRHQRRADPPTQATLQLGQGRPSAFTANATGLRTAGRRPTLAEPTVTAVPGESAQVHGRRHHPDRQNESAGERRQQRQHLHDRLHPVALRRHPQLHARRSVSRPHPVAHRAPRSPTSTTDAKLTHLRQRRQISRLPHPQQRHHGRALRRAARSSAPASSRTHTQQAINGVPGLINLPILGALFRSRDYQRKETELMIIVTPYIVMPIDPSQVVRPDPEFRGRQRSAGLVPRQGQPDLFDLRRAPSPSGLRRQDRLHHPMNASEAMRARNHASAAQTMAVPFSASGEGGAKRRMGCGKQV